ncbi:hypothetical protein HPB48_009900 [Haemaphysalis longicornis]|uniref:Uncharacterized protein n=1 Tax=Haemaphysalis longicornis TaxID=44386 RepID=A0A9J6GMP5_HAELO|nr:hypothetical protein HPB48_009900 [Haemaphysalis longicornis]
MKDIAAFVADMLGIGSRTMFAVKMKAQSTGGVLPTPFQKRPRNSEKLCSALYDTFTLNALRSGVHNFFRRNEIPTVAKITKEFSERSGDPSLSSSASRDQVQAGERKPEICAA